MLPIPVLSKVNETKKSILIIPSRIISRADQLEGGEETEIAAQITVPQEGGWGWVVVVATFLCILILDGVSFTFGSLMPDITADLQVSDSLVTLINSIAVALYFIAGPCASAFINRFGFRACIMSGAVIDSFALLCSFFSTSYVSLCMFYGVFAGVGYCFINMSSSLIVGFYFEKLRSLALSLATTGSSVGIMVMFPLNNFLVGVAGWRVVTLLHSALFGLIFFLGMTYKPLLSVTVVKTATADDHTRTVTYLPSLQSTAVRPSPSRTKTEALMPTATEKLFGAVSNINFPTAADVVIDAKATSTSQPGTSAQAVSKLTLTAHAGQGGMSQRQLKQVQSMISRSSIQDKTKRTVEVTVNVEPPKKRSCWARFCHWDDHIPESRPMYRDDAFYNAKLESLPVYQKSKMDTTGEGKTGLEYQLAVSRAVTTADLQERRGIFTTATRRILATMMDPTLLKRPSFVLLCCCGFLTYLGYLVPYVFIQDRNKNAGMDPNQCSLFVSVIGFANAIGRLVIGSVALKVNPIKMYLIALLASGSATICSNFTYNVYYQFGYCFIFGFFISSLAILRSMILVDLYGLDKLTNATGMMLMFQGIGSLISTPIASIVKNSLGYAYSFYIAGFFIAFSGICVVPVKRMRSKEKLKESQKSNPPPIKISNSE